MDLFRIANKTNKQIFTNKLNKMIKKLLLTTLPIIVFALFTSEQMSDNGKVAKTGASGEVNCTDCHGDYTLNSGGGSISIAAPTMAGFQYTPGQTYNMSVTVSRSANSLFGVGIEALTSGNANAGTINITDAASTQIKSATVSEVSRRNIVHTLDGGATAASKVFNFSWTAPASGTGNVTFYFAGVAGDGDGNESGDYVYIGSQLLTEISCTPPAQPAAISGSATLCSGTTTTYSVAAVSGATTYTWTLPSGWSGSSTTNSISVTSGSASGNITVAANNACGSSTASSMAVSGSTYTVNSTTTSVTCNGGANGSATVTNSGGTSPFTYSWSPSGGSAATANNLAAGNYVVTVTDNTGCIATTSVTISQPAAIAASAGADQSACNGSTVTLGGSPTGSGGTGTLLYSWNPATGLDNASAANPVCTPAANTSYVVTVTDANGCSSTAATNITLGTGTPATITLNAGVLETVAGTSYEWYYNGSYIPGSNTQTYTPTADGVYAVVVYFASGCISVSPDFTYIQTGINNVDASNSISVYPNPASNQISFVIDNVNDGGIATLVDVTGRTITTQIINSGLNTMDVSSFAKGAYFLTVKNGGNFSSTRIFVSR